jgi:hypothetical protein
MGLESGTRITQLNTSNPDQTDKLGEGDDHIRLIKTVLKGSFPGTSLEPIVPDPSGNSGKVLTNDGTDNSWSNSLSGLTLSSATISSPTITSPAMSGGTISSTTISGSSVESTGLTDYVETVNALGSGGGTRTVNLANGNVVTATVSTSTNTFAFTGAPTSGIAASFTLILTNGGSQTVNWPASVKWSNGVAPTLTASGVDVIGFTTVDAGTNWYGFASTNFS